MKLLFSIVFGLLLSCSSNSQSDNVQLKTQTQFNQWSSQPLYMKYGQVSALKVVYDVQNDKLYFISSEFFEFHYEFCMINLDYPNDLAVFNKEAYAPGLERDYLLANVNYYQALDKYTLELGPSDRMDASFLSTLFAKVKSDVFFGDKLFLMLNTGHVNGLSKELSHIPFLTPAEIYENQIYQPISKKEAEGRLVIITDWKSQRDTLKPTDIVVMNTIPPVFPLLSGVIVTEFQTPLSHVTLLGQNRKIPICAYTKAFELSSLLALDGQTVQFTVKQDTFELIPTDVDLSIDWKNNKLIHLRHDFTVDTLIPIQYINAKKRDIVGNKAAYFGELNRYSNKIDFKTPESAFAIPFYFYKAHAIKSGIEFLIAELVEKDNLNRPRVEIEKDLLIIQDKLLSATVDPATLKSIEDMIVRLGDYRRMRFRSSTNAEDRDGFSGAGLYQSKTVELGNPNKTIEKGLKSVWASLWSYAAFMEREIFHLDHQDAAMGILVHRSFPNEEVNGVAITTNLYRNNYIGFVVNAQLGDESVVQPESGIECDQFICYPDEENSYMKNGKGGYDIINFSNLNNSQLVMSDDEIQHLANVLEQIKKNYVRKHYIRNSYFNFGLDLEFKLDYETRELYIKQMRVYNR